MKKDPQETNGLYEATYRGARDAVQSTIQRAVSSVALFFVGVFGIGLLGMSTIALNEGTATQMTFFAALFGAAAAIFAGYELYHL